MSKRWRLFHLGLWGPDVNQGVDWEIEHHIKERVDELMAVGRSREQAEAEARRGFGDVARIRDELRGIDSDIARRNRVGQLIEAVWQDLRYGVRGLVRSPVFTISLVLTLGLGVGANVAMFGVLDALLLRPLPYAAPEELHELGLAEPQQEHAMPYLSWPFARDWKERQQVFTRMIIHARGSGLHTGATEPANITFEAVTADFEETLGVRPLLGRGFAPEDMRPGGAPVVVLDHAFWQSALGGDPAIVGASIEIDGNRHTVIGVMPKGFKFPEYASTHLWVPLRDDGSILSKPPRGGMNILGRIAPETEAVAQARAQPLGKSMLTEVRADDKREVRLTRFGSKRNVGASESVWLLSGAVILILLVAGANMVNLLLARGSVRTREIAVRRALGASRWRVIRQLGTETMAVTLLSSIVAVFFAIVTLRAIAGIVPKSITFFAPYAIAVEGRALLFAFAITVLCGVSFGILPAILATGRSPHDAGADLTRYASSTRARSRLRGGLVIAEVALSVTLLVGAGLLIHSFIRLNRIDPGFNPDNLVVMDLRVSSAAHPDAGERAEHVHRLEQAIEAIPGVQSVTVAYGLPPNGSFSFPVVLQAEGAEPHSSGNPEFLPFAEVRPDFFEVTGARLIAGRAFVPTDTYDSGNVIIDEDLARFLWPSANPTGRRFRIDSDRPWLTVVGVMADLKLLGPDDRRGDFELLHPASPGMSGSFAIRTRGDGSALLPAIRNAVRQIDANQPIDELETAHTRYGEAIDMPRFLLVLISVLAGLALLLAAVGVYGLLAFGVNQRKHEMSVRMALGARPANLTGMIVRNGFALTAVGVVLGLAGALAMSRFIRATLYGVDPVDPVTLITVSVTVIIVSLIASAVPARRAIAVDPASVLRTE